MKLKVVRTYQPVEFKPSKDVPKRLETYFHTDNKNTVVNLVLKDNLIQISNEYQTILVPLTNVCFFIPEATIEPKPKATKA